MKITILYGGKSGEHEVSLVSAAYVARNIDTSKHIVNLIGIDKDGKWYWQDQSELERIKEDETAALQIKKDFPVMISPGGGKRQAIQVRNYSGYVNLYTDIVFPVLHGTYGEDGTVQGLLDMAEIPYVGCLTLSSALTMDKEKTKVVWQSENLPIVPYTYLKSSWREEKIKEKIAEYEKEYGYPAFVKPCCAGSSVGASKAKDKKELSEAIEEAFKWDSKILIEKFIPAREIECSVVGNTDVKAYGPGEIKPSHEFYDYDAKYNDPNGAALVIPAELDKDTAEKIRLMAIKAFKVLDCSGLSRVDFFISKEDGAIMLNEINTMPGFTSISMFPKMCEASNIPYSELIEKLCQLGIENFESHHSLKTNREA